MRTTTETGRRGDVLDAEEYKDASNQARILLALANTEFRNELAKYREAESKAEDPADVKPLQAKVAEIKKLLTLVIDTRLKAITAGVSDKVDLDLEAAKDEVLRRLARLSV